MAERWYEVAAMRRLERAARWALLVGGFLIIASAWSVYLVGQTSR